MEGGKSTVVNGLPTTGVTLPQTKFCRTLPSCRTKNALVRICSTLVSMIKILPSGELSHLVVPENDYASDSEEEEEEEENEQRGGGVTAAADLSHLVVPDAD